MFTLAILNLLNLTVTMGNTTASTSNLFRDNARCSVIQSKNDNKKRMRRVIKVLVFQTTISILSNLRIINVNVSLERGYFKRKEPKPLTQTNEFSCKKYGKCREFFVFNVNYHLKGELVPLCNVPANWAKSVSDFFCLNQYLLAYFFS